MRNQFVMKLVTFVVVIFFGCVVGRLEGRVCTRVRSETGTKTVQYPGECHNSFEANCGWFSFEKCVFNETVACLKTRNITATIYRIVEECCPGYHRNREGKCVSYAGQGRGDSKEQQHANSGLKETVTSDSGDSVKAGSKLDSGNSRASSDNRDDNDDDGFFLGISHGAYAGIICGILFVVCVAVLTAVHYRKRRLQEEKKKATIPADQEAAQRQQMIPLEKMDKADPAAPVPT